MHIEQALPAEAVTVAAVLTEAAQWLAAGGRPLWSDSDVGLAHVQRQTEAGRFFAAKEQGEIVGVVRLDMEDPFYWPEIAPGSSVFLHKLAVRRSWAGKGVSIALLDFARERTRALDRPYLRLDCVADRSALRALYENFGFTLHSCIGKEGPTCARYELHVGSS